MVRAGITGIIAMTRWPSVMASKQVKMYGAYWCPHCAEQKEVLGSSYRFVYVECGVPGCMRNRSSASRKE